MTEQHITTRTTQNTKCFETQRSPSPAKFKATDIQVDQKKLSVTKYFIIRNENKKCYNKQ